MGLGRNMLATAALLALVGCGVGQTRLNPFNWFGSSTSEAVSSDSQQPTEPVVDQVLSLDVAATPSGAIVSAVGLPATQGFWDAELVRLPTDDASLLLLEFRILPPLFPHPEGTQPSREVLAATVLSNQDLAGIRTIAVQGIQNRRSVRR